MTRIDTEKLPIFDVLPRLKASLAAHSSLVISAPPGAGKTTAVPPALLGEPWLEGRRIVMLEPRRLAARSAANRISDILGEPVGRTVGYRTRTDSRISKDSRIEIVTEGIFTRQILRDPELAGVGAVIFDEFHERSIHADLGLALALDAQSAFRRDLRLIVMSATLDPEKVRCLFCDPASVSCEGRTHDVRIEHFCRNPRGRLEDAAAAAVLAALSCETGGILCFLPGSGEIRRTEERLRANPNLPQNTLVCPLYGDLGKEKQDAAIRPAPDGFRKIVLATSIAESSITIEGVGTVIDSGLSRKSVFDPGTGMSHLETVRESKASAEQRRGRAGRTRPGVCYRLWHESESSLMPDYDTPEIYESDLADLALSLAEWGVSDPERLRWLDIPPPAKFAQSVELLRELGAIDPRGRITGHGRKMLLMGTHPRLASMILRSSQIGASSLACDIAALLEERDIFRQGPGFRESDVRLRLDVLRRDAPSQDVDRSAMKRVRQFADDFRRRAGARQEPCDPGMAGVVLGFAYPDRIAKRRDARSSTYLLACGRSAKFAGVDPLSREEFLTVAELDDKDRDARIFLAAPLKRGDLDEHFSSGISVAESVEWDDREGAVSASGRRMFGQITLEEYPLRNPGKEKIVSAVLDGIRRRGLSALPWDGEPGNLKGRIQFAARIDGGTAWPDLSDKALLENLEEWIAPFLGGVRKASDFDKINLSAALLALLDWKRKDVLDTLAPSHFKVASGSSIRLDYTQGDAPALAVKVQELFGTKTHPCVGGGKVPVLVKILSPSMRPVQNTSDLPGFWNGSYQFVKKDLKGRYPKHYWPDNPMEAQPTRGLKPR